MTPEHWQLFGECVDHILNVMPKVMREANKTTSGFVKHWLLYLPIKRFTKPLKRYVDTMRRGEPPTSRGEESKWLYPDIPDLSGGDSIYTPKVSSQKILI
jgi:hypothetical protein